jgi:hypothetical protein
VNDALIVYCRSRGFIDGQRLGESEAKRRGVRLDLVIDSCETELLAIIIVGMDWC